jgi:hypothetical protein
MDPGDGTLFRFRRGDHGVAGDQHAQAQRHELDAGGRRRSAAGDQVEQRRRFLLRQSGVKMLRFLKYFSQKMAYKLPILTQNADFYDGT